MLLLLRDFNSNTAHIGAFLYYFIEYFDRPFQRSDTEARARSSCSLASCKSSKILTTRRGGKEKGKRAEKESEKEVVKVVGLAAPKGLANCRDRLVSVSTGKLGRS